MTARFAFDFLGGRDVMDADEAQPNMVRLAGLMLNLAVGESITVTRLPDEDALPPDAPYDPAYARQFERNHAAIHQAPDSCAACARVATTS